MYRDDREKEIKKNKLENLFHLIRRGINMKILKIVSLVKWKGSVIDWTSKIFPI